MIATALVALALTAPATEARVTVDHWPGCRTAACDRRVGKRIRERRRLRWLKRERPWEYRRRQIPAWLSAALARLRWCESRNNYRAENGPYSGGYQYHPSTWARAGGSGEAKDASPAEQDVRTARFWPSHRGEWSCKA